VTGKTQGKTQKNTKKHQRDSIPGTLKAAVHNGHRNREKMSGWSFMKPMEQKRGKKTTEGNNNGPHKKSYPPAHSTLYLILQQTKQRKRIRRNEVIGISMYQKGKEEKSPSSNLQVHAIYVDMGLLLSLSLPTSAPFSPVRSFSRSWVAEDKHSMYVLNLMISLSR